MITLGTAKEMYKLEGYPAELKDDVQSMLNILNINYNMIIHKQVNTILTK